MHLLHQCTCFYMPNYSKLRGRGIPFPILSNIFDTKVIIIMIRWTRVAPEKSAPAKWTWHPAVWTRHHAVWAWQGKRTRHHAVWAWPGKRQRETSAKRKRTATIHNTRLVSIDFMLTCFSTWLTIMFCSWLVIIFDRIRQGLVAEVSFSL